MNKSIISVLKLTNISNAITYQPYCKRFNLKNWMRILFEIDENRSLGLSILLSTIAILNVFFNLKY